MCLNQILDANPIVSIIFSPSCFDHKLVPAKLTIAERSPRTEMQNQVSEKINKKRYDSHCHIV